MLTARRAFRGETTSDTAAAVLATEPDWDALPVSLPLKLRDLLRRCLAKSRVERMRDIGDVGLEIAGLAETQPTDEANTLRSEPAFRRLPHRSREPGGLGEPAGVHPRS